MSFRKLCLSTSLALFLCGCAEADNIGKTYSTEQADFKLTEIAGDLSHPWSVAFLPDGSYLVTERDGKLWRIMQDGQKKEIKGVPPVYAEGQGGLLDIQPIPEFKDNDWVYFSYSGFDPQEPDNANTEVARAKLNLLQNRLSHLEVIFKAEPKVRGGNHWGSRLLFVGDDMLYITLGERYSYMEEAQSTKNHFGTLIRIKRDGSIPEDNPFVNELNDKPEIYSYGHRNVQGIDLNPDTGEVWAHEHGPRGGDEINIIKPGANYGWPKVTFGIDYSGLTISDKTTMPGMEDPILQWTPSIAPSGMAFYTGDKYPQWKGDLFVGALSHQHLRRLELDGNKIIAQEELLKDMRKRIRDVAQGPDGYLYILTDEPNGKLLRLDPK